MAGTAGTTITHDLIEPAAYEDEREWVQLAIMMVTDGYSISQAARMLEMHYETVWHALKPSKKKRRNRKRHPTNPSCTVCGQPMSYRSPKPEPVCRPCKKAHGRRHDEAIIEMWLEGMKSDEIAEALGDITPLAVGHRVNNMRTHQGIELPYRR